VVVASDGLDGLAAFERETPNCVLLDVRMPDVDGFGVCERIRALPAGADTPVIFLTAQRDVETFDHALKVGADDFLTKPVQPAELVVRVRSALKLTQLRAERREHYELLKKQRDDLMRLQLQKERLTAFVVHDLKNPVATMTLLAEEIESHPEISATTRESAADIRVAGEQLNRMILNLLDLAKADEGQLAPKLHEVSIAALVSGALDELRVLAASRAVGLEHHLEAVRCRADANLLHRMLANLIENAIRHAPEGSAVRVNARTQPGAVEFRVADCGNGVPADLRERIFSPFVQIEAGDGRPSTRTGRGLGLAFCQAVAKGHDGAIWVEDGAPGSVFCVRLPDSP
jgi:signal transduction histidine kinase